MSRRFAARRGFTLLELSVVIGIIALIAGVGMNMASGAITAANRIQSQERLNTIKQALDSYARTYGYLPCPSSRAAVPSNITFGNEARPGGTGCTASGPGIIQNGNVWIGAVPVRTLGLPDNYAGDAWGNKLTYAVSDALKTAPYAYSTQPGQISVLYRTSAISYSESSAQYTAAYSAVTNNGGLADLSLLGAVFPPSGAVVSVEGFQYTGSSVGTGGGASVTLASIPWNGSSDSGYINWQVNAAGAAYVVVSHGPDGLGAFPMLGTAVPANKPCGTGLDANNCNGGTSFVDIPYNDGVVAAEHYDDFIVWGSNNLQGASLGAAMYRSCPAGVCEPWCANCNVNYPSGVATNPPTSITANPVLYKKLILSDAASCKAYCIWGGMTGGGFVRAP
jgi:prepilin-type N-terminal cleavage/methylation domain-containing protein